MPLIILLYFLYAQHVSGITNAHHQELATMVLITTRKILQPNRT